MYHIRQTAPTRVRVSHFEPQCCPFRPTTWHDCVMKRQTIHYESHCSCSTLISAACTVCIEPYSHRYGSAKSLQNQGKPDRSLHDLAHNMTAVNLRIQASSQFFVESQCYLSYPGSLLSCASRFPCRPQMNRARRLQRCPALTIPYLHACR